MEKQKNLCFALSSQKLELNNTDKKCDVVWDHNRNQTLCKRYFFLFILYFYSTFLRLFWYWYRYWNLTCQLISVSIQNIFFNKYYGFKKKVSTWYFFLYFIMLKRWLAKQLQYKYNKKAILREKFLLYIKSKEIFPRSNSSLFHLLQDRIGFIPALDVTFFF